MTAADALHLASWAALAVGAACAAIDELRTRGALAMRVKFTKTAFVRDRKFVRGQEDDLDDEAAKDAIKSGVAAPVGAEVRAAVDAAPGAARKAVKLGG